MGRAFRTVPERTRVVIEEREGVVFTDHRGYRLDRSGRPVPPRRPVEAAAAGLGIPAGAWSHPSGERLDPGAVSFHEPAA